MRNRCCACWLCCARAASSVSRPFLQLRDRGGDAAANDHEHCFEFWRQASGNGQRRTISLFAKTFTRFKVYVIRDEFSPLASGRITIRVKSLGPNKVARIDALLIQPVGGR